MIRVGIVGCGTIGSYLGEAVLKRFSGRARLTGFCEPLKEKVSGLGKKLNRKIKLYSLSHLIEKSDLIIEAAGQEAAVETAEAAIRAGKEVMIMSVGGLLSRPGLLSQAKRKKVRVYVPSGAIAGLDAINAAARGRIKKVSLTTRKPPAGLAGAPYLKKKGLDLTGLKQELIVFSGTAAQAVKAFPKNINVAAVLSLAGIGAARTMVRIIACPGLARNTHSIEIDGDFGKIVSQTENVPSKQNPKTSQLAILSAEAMLERILSAVRIGT